MGIKDIAEEEKFTALREKFGADLVEFVFAVNLATEALNRAGGGLRELAQSRAERRVVEDFATSLAMLGDAVELLANRMAQRADWTLSRVEECSSAILRVVDGQLVGPDGKILQ